MPTLGDRCAGCLLGLALGDALGFVVEAEPPDVAEAYVARALRRTAPTLESRPELTPGQYSDDTQLARELCRSLAACDGWRPDDFAARLAALFSAGADVGAGRGTREAALRLVAGASWLDAATPEPYAGNGTAIRVAPVGLVYGRDPRRLVEVAAEQARVTHGDPRSAAGAVAIAGAAALGVTQGRDAVGLTGTLVTWCAPYSRDVAEAVGLVPMLVRLAPAEAAGWLAAAGLDPWAPAPWMGISGFVVPSVVWSLYSFLRAPDDYIEAVATAIAVGGDTDSMAAMTGALVGARVGVAGLPAELARRVHDRGAWDAPALETLARACATLAERPIR